MTRSFAPMHFTRIVAIDERQLDRLYRENCRRSDAAAAAWRASIGRPRPSLMQRMARALGRGARRP